MISQRVSFNIISAVQLVVGIILMILNRVAMFESTLHSIESGNKATGALLWWLYGFPFLVIATVGFAVPKRQSYMVRFLILNIIGLVIALCWWAEMIHMLTVVKAVYNCYDYDDPEWGYESLLYKDYGCKTLGFLVGLTLVTGIGALSCVIAIVMAARNISNGNTIKTTEMEMVQNGGYMNMNSQQVNPIALQATSQCSAQAIPGECCVPSQPAASRPTEFGMTTNGLWEITRQ